MKIELTKLCEFEIPYEKDRRDLCAILSTAGYAVCVEERCDYSRSFPYKFYVVVVYGKDGERDEET